MDSQDYISTSEITKTISTKGCKCFVVFPKDETGCHFVGLSEISIALFKSASNCMFNSNGRGIDFDDITPEQFSMWCHRPDLGVLISDGVLKHDQFLYSDG